VANYSNVNPTKITSRDNSLLRHARAVRDGKVPRSIFVEGLRLCEEAFQSNLHIEAVLYSEEIARKERAALLIEQLAASSGEVASVSERLLESISYTTTPQGIILLAARPAIDDLTFKANQSASSLLVVLHGLNNPVNVGAVLRTAEAAGANAVITTAHTSDPFSPKALRGAMGSAFRLPIWIGADFDEVVAWCSTAGIRTLAAAAAGSSSYTEIDWSRPTALILGSESAGLSREEMAAADDVVLIPMLGSVESLNVAVATGVLLFEAMRQRDKK
jgi:TrmH family RNA methyltransferase